MVPEPASRAVPFVRGGRSARWLGYDSARPDRSRIYRHRQVCVSRQASLKVTDMWDRLLGKKSRLHEKSPCRDVRTAAS